jgi:sec-independent protein translocase protein TatA
MNLGPVELLVILGIVLLLFGAKKLPELARSMGKSTREFKRGLKDDDDEATPTDAPSKSKSKSES